MANQWQRWRGIMKAYPFEEKRLAKWQPPYIVQPKYDGVRCRAVSTGTRRGYYFLLSSEENVIFSVPHINEALDRLGIDTELDGELYCHEMKFEEIVSITSRTVNIHPDHRRIDFHVFDVVTEDSQDKRIIELNQLSMYWEPPLVPAPFWLCYSLECIMKVYDGLING